jgi:hypothetical protein
VTVGTGSLLAPLSQLPFHARMLAQCAAILLGADVSGQPSGVLTAIAAAHLPGLAAVALGLAVAMRCALSGRAGRVCLILTAGTGAMLAAGLLGPYIAGQLYAHEIAPLAPLGAALAGRVLGDRLAAARPRAAPHARYRRLSAGHAPGGTGGRPPGRWLHVRYLCLFIGRAPGGTGGRPPGRWLPGAALAVGLAFLGYNASLPPYEGGTRPLADWLVSHHLRSGIAGYWQASAVTVNSRGKVSVVPVLPATGAIYRWEAEAAWYDPRLRSASFVVTVAGPSGTGIGPQARQARVVFGPPARVYRVRAWVIQVWNRDLLPDVQRATRETEPRS